MGFVPILAIGIGGSVGGAITTAMDMTAVPGTVACGVAGYFLSRAALRSYFASR